MVCIELRDRYDFQKQAASKDMMYSRNEAQVAAMLENAKNSSWQQNLHNASDAQQRFMLPNLDIDNEFDVPEYVKRIDARSQEILSEREKDKEDESDPSRTRFWK